MKNKKFKMGDLQNRALIESYNETDNTIVVICSTGERGLRSGWFNSFYEELEISDKAIRMERLQKGAPFLKNHRASIDDQIGVVTEAWIEGKNLLVKIRLSESEAHASIVNDIKSGIIKNISVGYRVYKYEEIAVGEDEIPVYRATDWEPLEVSAVAIGFDSLSQTRSIDNNYECEIIYKRTGEIEMSGETKPVEETKPTEEVKPSEETKPTDETKPTEEAKPEEATREVEIVQMVRKANMGIELAEKYILEKRSTKEVSDLLIEEMAKRQGGQVKPQITVENDQKELTRDGMANAILHRAGISKELTDNGKRFRNLSLMDMARHASGLDMTASRDEIVNRAFHANSDFPSILLDATNKALQAQYGEMKQTFDPFVRRVSLSDFKVKNTVKMGDFPELKKVVQNEEVKAGTIAESKEAYKMDSYATKIKISRQALINDDLEAFSRLPQMAARSAKYLESKLVYDLITSNPNMGDGKKLFHADHKNIVTGPALDVANLDLAWAAMKKQVGIDGKTKLNLTPANILAPVALEAAALRLVSKEMLASDASKINVYAGRLGVISDALLDDSSLTKWYLLGLLGEIDIFEIATLDGSGPKTHMEEIFATGVSFSVLHDVGVGIIDHRGIVGVGTFA